MTLGEALAAGIRLLTENEVPSPGLDAEVLLAHCLGEGRPWIHAHRTDTMDPTRAETYASMLARRAAREPLQYITRTQEFYGRPFTVNPSVLIPRPETEFVVETVLAFNAWREPAIVDVGTGSGCIATTLALEIPTARVYASDLDRSAVMTARHNSRALGASVRFACADGLEAWGSGFHFIASNPPYVSEDEGPGLQPEVRDHEPHLALFGNHDPIDFYRRLFAEAEDRLVEGGLVVVEIGYTMEETIRGMLGGRWDLEETVRDLQGIPRVIAARRPRD